MRSLQAGDDANAIAGYQALLKLDPSDVQSWTNLGVLFGKNKDLKSSLKCLQEAVQRDPNFAMAHANLGTTLRNLGQYDLAIEHLETALELEPSNDVTRRTLKQTRTMRASQR